MNRVSTLHELMTAGAETHAALTAPGREPLSFAALRSLVADTGAALNRLGIGRGDRVAIVLPNGPEMAAAFIAIASYATAAPLNPGYRADEFEFYMGDLRAKALVVEAGSASPALEVAHKMGVRVLTLRPALNGGAGAFTLHADEDAAPAAHAGPAQRDDIALILHTSGTTSRPKIVPLSQRNVCVSAGNIAATLAFSAADRGLNIMPLFHIHGLMAGILAPLSAGGGVFCTPGFNALKFFGFMEECRPTWYTAVPTMHQAILTRAAGNRATIERHRLRFIRSSSSSMPPQVVVALEAAFGAPVIESYGMTEASHQMASNLIAGPRKPGAVGVAAGPQIAVMGEDGALLGVGETGEVVIRGENVTLGYENNATANATAFVAGWFRTGDQGVLDADGHLLLTGRLKEIINRGGEKVSPREVDEVLMDHPAVQQVVVFGMPHKMLGEDVAAAVVLREGEVIDEKGLRAFVAERLADFKVPRKILFLDAIPLGATGKLQRIGLAEKLGLAG